MFKYIIFASEKKNRVLKIEPTRTRFPRIKSQYDLNRVSDMFPLKSGYPNRCWTTDDV